MPRCTLSTPGAWRLTTGQQSPYDQRWHPTVPCVYSINSTAAFLRAYRGMTVTFLGDSVTRNALRAIGKLVLLKEENDFEQFALTLNAEGAPAADAVTLRFRHTGTAAGISSWLEKPQSGTFALENGQADVVTPGALNRHVWVMNAGLWNSAWPNSIMNQNWSAMPEVTLPLVLSRYEEQLVKARDGIMAAVPGLRDSCTGRSRLVFRLSTPVLNKVPARDGWLAWAHDHFGDVDSVVQQLNDVARRVWGSAGLPVIELSHFTSAPADVRPRLTLDNVHVPDSISVDMMWWILSALYDAGLSADGPVAASGAVEGFPPCDRTGGVTATPDDAGSITRTPGEDPLVLLDDLPGVPLALRRVAAAEGMRRSERRRAFPTLPAVLRSDRSELVCDESKPHNRRCRIANVCLERPQRKLDGTYQRPQWLFYGGTVDDQT